MVIKILTETIKFTLKYISKHKAKRSCLYFKLRNKTNNKQTILQYLRSLKMSKFIMMPSNYKYPKFLLINNLFY